MEFELEWELKLFREEQPSLFDEVGERYSATPIGDDTAKRMLNIINLLESALAKETEQQCNCNLPNVSGALPLLITEKYDDYYLAYLKGINGMVVEAQSEDEAIDELMISIRVKLLHDRQ